ncbi:catalase-like domain-containing protein [Aspergillus pseudoustus]|uniref:Catalase-like domain-containing protein n=1 Tax=Aspergillus pseudoustus TaxID=1810923 RepID=A0ABR4L1J5_9EURO
MATHPHSLQAIDHALGAADGDPRPTSLVSLVQCVQSPGKRADDGPHFPTNEAIPFPDQGNSKTAEGSPLISDTFLLQKRQHANRSNNLERVRHVWTHIEVTKDVSALTKANDMHLLLVSALTVLPDLVRNPRELAIKFYTGVGDYDIVRLDFNFLPDHNSLFDLLASTPLGDHAVMTFSRDHGTPNGWTNSHSNSWHTLKWREFVYIKYYFRADHGQKQFIADEALKYGGEVPDYSKRELWHIIEKGEVLTWAAQVQVMQPNEAVPSKSRFDPSDVKHFPPPEFGKLHGPGIEDSPDRLLQFRMLFHRAAQYHRVGNKVHQVPVNCPFTASSYSSLNFDGPQRIDANHALNPPYAPNSCKSHIFYKGKPSENYQARNRYMSVMDARARQHLRANTYRPTLEISRVYRIVPEYAKGFYNLLPEFGFAFPKRRLRGGQVRARRSGGRNRRLLNAEVDKLVCLCPAMSAYNA